MHYVARSPRRPRKTNKWPEYGSCSRTFSASAESPLNPFLMSVTPAASQDLRLRGNRDHALRPRASRTTMSGSKTPLSVNRWPDARAISIQLSLAGLIGSDATVTSVDVTSTDRKDAASRPGPNRGSRRHRNTMFAFSP